MASFDAYFQRNFHTGHQNAICLHRVLHSVPFSALGMMPFVAPGCKVFSLEPQEQIERAYLRVVPLFPALGYMPSRQPTLASAFLIRSCKYWWVSALSLMSCLGTMHLRAQQCFRMDIMACRVDGVPIASHDIMRSMMLLHALSEALASPQFLSFQAFLEGKKKGLMVKPSFPGPEVVQ